MIIDPEEVLRHVAEDSDSGFCIKCGAENGPVEPDARKYQCESCGEFAVYGAEELMFHIVAY